MQNPKVPKDTWVKVHYGRRKDAKTPVPTGILNGNDTYHQHYNQITWYLGVNILKDGKFVEKCYKSRHFRRHEPTLEELSAWALQVMKGVA